MIDPTLIFHAVQAAIRLAKASARAYNQAQRERDMLFPNASLPTYGSETVLAQTFGPGGTRHDEVDEEGKPLFVLWPPVRQNDPVGNANRLDQLYAEAMKGILASANPKASREDVAAVAAITLVEQWNANAAPPSPLLTLVITLADIALEFVGTNPAITGLSGTRAKLLAAVSAEIAVEIPDDPSEWEPQVELPSRLLAAFLRGGLKGISETAPEIANEAHLRELIQGVVKPLTDNIPKFDDAADRGAWVEAREALVTDSANAALSVLGRYPKEFLGRHFKTGNGLGAVTQEIFKTAAEQGIETTLSVDGLKTIYMSLLSLAEQKPSLFLGAVDNDQRELLHAAFISTMKALKDLRSPIGGDAALTLVAAVIEALGPAAGRMLKPGEPWEKSLKQVIVQITEPLSQIVAGGGKNLDVLTSKTFLADLGRTVVREIASTPGMLAGDNKEVQLIVQAVVTAMADDAELLLAPDDWLKIAAVAAEETARNPGRLFDLNANSALSQLGSIIISRLLLAARDDWKNGGRPSAGLLFGATLREAIITTIQTTVGNVKAGLTNIQAISDLIVALNLYVRQSSQGAAQPALGSKQWLRLYRVLLGRVLASGQFGAITDKEVQDILTGATRA